MTLIYRIRTALLGVLLLSLVAGGCATLTGATVGGAAGAGIGAATDNDIGRSAAIGAGVGGTAGALYDVFNWGRRYDRDRRYYD